MPNLRWFTAGESHGPELVAIIEGMPAGISLTSSLVEQELARRRLGYGRGARQKFEQDLLTISGGVVQGLTLGSPIAFRIGNSEWPKWAEIMSADPCEVSDPGKRAEELSRPRPGHADLAGMQKYGFLHARPVLERASARETAARVALGAAAKAFLRELNINVLSHTVRIGSAAVAEDYAYPTYADLAKIDADPLRCFDAAASEAMIREVEMIKKAGDTVGGVVEVLAYGLPPGLGSYVQWDRRLDARLAGALMSIQAIKGVEIGDGFLAAQRPGSKAHDEISLEQDHLVRTSNRSGGTEGGMSTGGVLRVRAAMKPIATVPRALNTVDISAFEPAKAHHQRSDVCAVAPVGVIAEAMAALVIADAVLEKFGGDSLTEVQRNLAGYLAAIPRNLTSRIDR